MDGSVLPAGDMGYWWKGDMLAKQSIEENIRKARRAFFLFGSIGVFQGDLSPLSSRSLLETCMMPVLLNGLENWLMTRALVERVDCFQGEMAKSDVTVIIMARNGDLCADMKQHDLPSNYSLTSLYPNSLLHCKILRW